MNYVTIAASKPGTPPPKLEKRTSDVRTYLIDCSALLAPGEMVLGEIVYKCNAELQVLSSRTRQGRYIQVKLGGGPTTMPFVEYPVRFNVNTTADNVVSVPLVVKAYSD